MWFVYYVRRGVGAPAVDPATKQMLGAIKEDVERVEALIGDLAEKVASVEKCQAVMKNELSHVTTEINRMRK